jgi:hypothetical protein
MAEPTPEEKEAARRAKVRARSKAQRDKIRADPERTQARRDSRNAYARHRYATDPEYRRKRLDQVIKRLVQRASKDGGDPEFRAKKSLYQKRYRARKRAEQRAKAADPGPQS